MILEFDIALHRSKSERLIGEFFYETENGFNERETVKLEYQQAVDGQFSHYAVKFPVPKMNSLRFDPLQDAGWIVIKNIRLKKYFIRDLNYLDREETLIPIQAIESIDFTKNGIDIKTNGSDPHLLLTNNTGTFSLAGFSEYLSSSEVDKLAAGILALLLLSFLLTSFVQPSQSKKK